MRVLVFGATGMVGAGVLRECLLDSDVEEVLTVGRRPTGIQHPKLREIVHEDLMDLSSVKAFLTDFDACFYCLGVTSVGMKEEEYRKISYDMTLEVAKALLLVNSGLTFAYVSGAGTDSSEQGRVMWARVKGATENALLRMPLKGAYMFRPAAIQPLHGIRSKTAWYQAFYTLFGPLLTLGRRYLPQYVTTTEQLGHAMLAVAKRQGGRGVLESADINQL